MSAFRDSIRSVVKEELSKSESGLSSVGLAARYNGLEPRSYGSDEKPATEVSISIREGTNLVDRLEFFIERNGEPAVTPEEVREWLRHELDQIVADFPHGGGWEAV